MLYYIYISMSYGLMYRFAGKLRREGLTMMRGSCDNPIGSVLFDFVRFRFARFGWFVPFGGCMSHFSQYVKSYLIKISEALLPKSGFIAPSLRLFLYAFKGGDALW